jgi:hypothetical protein
MRRGFLVVVLCVVAAACSTTTTQLIRTWRSPAYTPREVKRVLVIGLTPNQHNRKVFEYAMAARLQAMKYQPLAGYDVLPKERVADRALLSATVKEKGIELVLVSRLVSVQTEAEYVPPTYYSPYSASYTFYPYYSTGYETVYAPGYVTTRQVVYLETNAYDAQTEQIVWSSISRTFDYASIEDVSDSVAKEIVHALHEQGVM